MDIFNQSVRKVLEHEGGYVNDPDDPGGATNFGISDRADGVLDGLIDLDRDGVPDVDPKQLTVAQAVEYYRRWYWIPARCLSVPVAIMGLHLDTAVNMGVRTAIRILQRACNVKDDGVFGPVTADAARHCTPAAYVRERLAQYDRIIAAKPSLAKFRKGWERRTKSWL